MTYTMKRLTACTFQQLHEVWVSGFEGYFFDMNMPLDNLMSLIVSERLSADLSVVAFDGDRPIGFVLSGTRLIGGQKVAWNGGTGLAKEYRGRGIGRQLMEAALAVYREEGVELATLEVVQQNESAYQLYGKLGYEVVDQLYTYELAEVQDGQFIPRGHTRYLWEHGAASDVRDLPFLHDLAPWQMQWPHIANGETIRVLDPDGDVIGYALFRRVIGADDGQLRAVILNQCWADPARADGDEIIRFALSHVFTSTEEGVRNVSPLTPASNSRLTRVLQEEGFAARDVSLYNMWKKMK